MRIALSGRRPSRQKYCTVLVKTSIQRIDSYTILRMGIPAYGERFMPIRRFTEDSMALCNLWYEQVETSDEWDVVCDLGASESRPIKVRNQNGLTGVAKPGPACGHMLEVCRAAHEKLAFDLTHLLELPIPPVILWNSDPEKFIRGRAISAWAFNDCQSWDEAARMGVLTPDLIATASEAISAMRAFHTWISDTDRKSDHTQINIASDARGLGLAFIDQAFSMSMVWKGPNHPGGACGNYLPAPENKEVTAQVADRILGLPNNEIQRLVDRIPSLFLPDTEKSHIRDNLLSRKGSLRALLGV